MRINQRLLQGRCGLIQPKFAKHIDLSHSNIVTLEGLNACCNVQSLILRHNSISVISNVIASLTEIWKLDLSHNLICSLDGLLRVRCIGTLVLSYNNLIWSELGKIQHMIILDLRLVGNPKLERDPYYRRHVIDCLPNVWMLDGILVTSPERDQVAKFFQNSEVLDRPARHKLKTSARFVPTHLKMLSQQAVLGKAGLCLMSKFSQTENHTLNTDFRRLQYIAETIECDLMLQRSYWGLLQNAGCMPPESSSPIPAYMSHHNYLTHSSTCNIDKDSTYDPEDEESAPRGFGAVPPLLKLLECRQHDVERCNMLLLLLVAGLEFSLPVSLLEDTLHAANLYSIGNVDCLALLQLPHSELLLTCSIFLSSVIVDRGNTEQGGLYKRLFVALYVVLSNLLRTTHGYPNKYQLKYMSPALHRSLLAAEVVQLMCLVPSFIDLIERDQGVLDVVAIATQIPHIKDIISDIVWNNSDSAANNDFEEVNNALLHFVRMSIDTSNYELMDLEQGLVPYHRPLSAVSISTNRNIHRRAKSGVASRHIRSKGTVRVPQLGDMVLLPRQRKGRVIGLHQDQLALIQISEHPVSTLKDTYGEYVYVDMQFMRYNEGNLVWKQQEHVQEYATERKVEKVEKCYSVVSSNDSYNNFSYKDQKPTNTSEVGDAYYVHEDKSLHLEVNDDVVRYMSHRPKLPITPGLNGVFAREEDVHSTVTPQREAVPALKEVLDFVTEQSINKNLEKTVPAPTPTSTPTIPLYKTPKPSPTEDPDIMHPSSDIKVVPMTSLQSPEPAAPPLRQEESKVFTQPSGSAWSNRSGNNRRPNTRASFISSSRQNLRSRSSHHRPEPTEQKTDYNLFTKQKSLPDVSGISIFTYSMGGVGVIKPPDITDHLATSRCKDIKSQKYKIRPVLR